MPSKSHPERRFVPGGIVKRKARGATGSCADVVANEDFREAFCEREYY